MTDAKTFIGKEKKISKERVWAWSGGPISEYGWPARNIHTSNDFSKLCGLDKIYVSATQYLAYICELMISIRGVREWLEFGSLKNVKFIKPVTFGDCLTVYAEETGGWSFDVWVENQNGEKVAIGEAILR